ncbi:MAG: hypothetical protein Ct9H300mP16_01540 [Pseudomonadota bacterium]|nr:MAG: hypothetical protein Ct9H300mP16_01540 [Pseudomonadota bacterium]
MACSLITTATFGGSAIEDFKDRQHEPLSVLNEIVEVPQALEDCVIAGSADTVLNA